MEAVCGDLRVPIWLEGWGRKKSRNMNAKVKVVATETLSIPAEHERFLPAVASTRIPKEWSNKMMIFEPTRSWRGCEIGRFASNASISEFPVLTKNMGKTEIVIAAGTILGHLEVLSESCRVKHLRQDNNGVWKVSEDVAMGDSQGESPVASGGQGSSEI